MLLKVSSFGPAGTNVYLIGCSATHQAAVIDAPLGCSHWVKQQAEKHSLSIRFILLTHSHWDHTAEAALLQETFKAPLYIHQKDAENVEHPGSDGLPLLFPIPSAHPDGFLTDGQILTLGELQIEVLHTPGHTPGCVCFYLPKEKVLFSGDTLFQGTIGNLSFPTARPTQMWTSLKKLVTLPADTTVYPGHGDPTTIGEEKWIARAQEILE